MWRPVPSLMDLIARSIPLSRKTDNLSVPCGRYRTHATLIGAEIASLAFRKFHSSLSSIEVEPALWTSHLDGAITQRMRILVVKRARLYHKASPFRSVSITEKRVLAQLEELWVQNWALKQWSTRGPVKYLDTCHFRYGTEGT